jgi:hypothetical protein
MRGGTIAAASGPESGPLSQRYRMCRAVDRSVVVALVSDLLSAGASTLAPAELLTVVCEAAKETLSLTHAVFFKRLAGQSRSLAWSTRGVPAASLMAAREEAWSTAAELVEGGWAPPEGAADAARVFVRDDDLGLSATLYVESRRPLDRRDRALLADLLRRMLGLPQSVA